MTQTRSPEDVMRSYGHVPPRPAAALAATLEALGFRPPPGVDLTAPAPAEMRCTCGMLLERVWSLDGQTYDHPVPGAYDGVRPCARCNPRPDPRERHPLRPCLLPCSSDVAVARAKAHTWLDMLAERPRRAPGRVDASEACGTWVRGGLQALVLYGPSGSGKTYLALHAWAAMAQDDPSTAPAALDEGTLVEAYQQQWADDPAVRRWAGDVRALLRRSRCVLIDDLGADQRATQGVAEARQEAIKWARENTSRLLVTTNLAPHEVDKDGRPVPGDELGAWRKVFGSRTTEWLAGMTRGAHVRVTNVAGGRP